MPKQRRPPRPSRTPAGIFRTGSQATLDLPALRNNTVQQLAGLLGVLAQIAPALSGSSRTFSPLGAPAGGNSPTANGFNQFASLFSQLLRVLGVLGTAHLANTAATTANTAATVQNSTATAGLGAGGAEGGSGGLLGKLLGGFSRGLSIASLGLSLFSLFRGPQQSRLDLKPFQAPTPLSLEVANTDNILRGLPRFDFSADGTPRPMDAAASSAATGAATGQSPMQVTVNVSAMDSRSFLDNAPILAQAVREAMLHMHPINQLVRESF